MFFKGIAYFFLALSQTIFATIITLIIQQRLTNALIGLFSQPQVLYSKLICNIYGNTHPNYPR